MGIPVIESVAISNQSSSTTSLSCTAPSGIADDDILIICVALDGTAGNPTSTGFTALQNPDSGSNEFAFLWKRASSESGNYTVSWTGSEQARIAILRVSGCVTAGSPIDQSPTGQTGVSTSVTVSALTSTVDDTLCIAGVSVDFERFDDTETVTGTGWSKALTFGYSSSGNFGASLGVAEKDLASTGSSGTCQFSSWASNDYAAAMINLKGADDPAGFAHSQGIIIG